MNRYERNNVVIVILVALLFVITTAIVYFVYFNKPVEEEKKDSIFVQVEDEKIIKELTDTIMNNNLEVIASLEKDVDNINTLSNKDKLSVAFPYVFDKTKDAYENGIDTKLFDEYYKNAFNTSIYWNKEDIDCTCDKKLFLYDKEKEKYVYNEQHLGHGVFSINPYYKKVLEVLKKNETYVIKMSYIWGYFDGLSTTNTGYPTHNDVLNNTNKLFEIDIPEEDVNDINYYALKEIENNYDNYKDKLHTYVYTFEKVDNNYLLSSFRFEK